MPSPNTQYREYKTDESKAKTYEHRLFIAEQDYEGYKSEAEDWYHRYENLPRRQQVTVKGHRVNVPTGPATIDALYSAMTAVDVDVHTRSMGHATRAQAELATAALMKEWRVLGVQDSTNAATKDGLIVGIGWVKVAYEYQAEMQTVPRETSAVRDEIVALMREASEADGKVPDALTIAGLVPVEEEVEKVLRDRIVVDYVPWDMVRWDPTAKRIEDVTWVAQLSKVRAEEVKENPAYQEYTSRSPGNSAKLKKLKGDSTLDLDKLPDGKATKDDEFLTVVEFWDFQTGTVCTFVKGQDWLLDETANPFALNFDFKDRSPFVPLILRKTNTRLRGISDMELMAPSLDEQAMYRSNTATFVERFVPKVMGPEDALTEEGKTALSSKEYGAYVSIATGSDASQVQPLIPPALPTEVFDLERRVEDGIREATGVNELMRGLFPDRKRTATETSEVVSASTARQSEKRNTLEQFYLDIARRILQLMQVFYDAPRMLRYIDPSVGEVPWEFTAEDIAVEYDLELHLTPKEAVTAQSIREDAMALFNFLVPHAEPGPDGSSAIDKTKLIQWLCTEYGLSKQDQLDILNLPEEKQAQQLAAQQTTAGMASAAAGQPQPGLTQGPLGPEEVAALTNQGAVPPEVAAAASAGIVPTAPQAVEAISESAGVG